MPESRAVVHHKVYSSGCPALILTGRQAPPELVTKTSGAGSVLQRWPYSGATSRTRKDQTGPLRFCPAC